MEERAADQAAAMAMLVEAACMATVVVHWVVVALAAVLVASTGDEAGMGAAALAAWRVAELG